MDIVPETFSPSGNMDYKAPNDFLPKHESGENDKKIYKRLIRRKFSSTMM